MLSKLIAVAVLSLGMAFADTVTAVNAGPLPAAADDLSGDASLGVIIGSLYTGYNNSSFPNFESVFKINILNYLLFSAETVPVGAHGIPDTDLFLFDSTGHGVYGNDDISGSNTLSCLPSLSSNPCPSSRNGTGPTHDGIYYLAIAISADYPISSAGEIFNFSQSTNVVGPDLALGGALPISGWDNGAFTSPDFDNVNYEIVLNGTAPEPATWLLIAAPLLALWIARKRMA
ncbi:MAG: hypothetical protein JO211_03320 [Acidobacteriaceae bacterium]|nr:hypothetical protein [Acidobacteriaceae bacterium]